MTSLYALTGEYLAVAEKLADLDLPEEVIRDTLEGLSGELEAKATHVAMFARNLEATAEAIKAAERDMKARREAIEKRADSLRRYLLGSMQVTGITKIECPYFRIAVRNNPEAVEIIDAREIPPAFLRLPEPPCPHRTRRPSPRRSRRDRKSLVRGWSGDNGWRFVE